MVLTMNFSCIEDMIKTPFGDTYIKCIGLGPPVFVIHGGPGFDHRYLVSGLEALAQKRTLIFYDQPGCGLSGATSSLSPFEVFSHFRWLSHHLSEGQPSEVIAHSWGALVFVGAVLDNRLSEAPVANFQGGLLINPVPMNAKKYALCAKILLKRLSWVDRFRLSWRGVVEPSGGKIMDLLLPYYVVDQKSLSNSDLPLHKNTYLQMSRQLKIFDYISVLHRLPKLVAAIGTEDFITPDLLDDLIPHLTRVHMMNRVGHFPFWEEPEEFRTLLFSSFGLKA